MKRGASSDDNIFRLLDGRCSDSGQVLHPFGERKTMRALQTHPSLLNRLHLYQELEGHEGCVNTIAWNSTGSLLVSGSDDTRVNIWDYSSRKLLQSVDTGHFANIFCTKFLPETGDDVVASGAADAEVRVHRLSRVHEPMAVFLCHSKRVKKLAVEDGNPHIIWSASEDGTLRQHDLREGVRCESGHCGNILLDLRYSGKRSLAEPPRQSFALKTCALSPTRSHQILVGGSDAFARLYDRRMLPPPSSSQDCGGSAPCVCYYCPAHLSDHTKPSMHLTHVTFSPNGEEVLISYSGEHVYLMDAFNGESSSVYVASDVRSRTSLVPLADPSPRKPQNRVQGHLPQGKCLKLFGEARMFLGEENFLRAIEAAGEVIDDGGPSVDPILRHECLCLRAEAFIKRGWKNDVHMAIRDGNEARVINPLSAQAHHILAEALSKLGRHKEAIDFESRACYLEPSNATMSDNLARLHSKLAAAEDAKNSKKLEGEGKSRSSRIRSLRGLFFRPEDLSDSSDESRRAERDESDMEDDMEMEMEIEMSVAGNAERDQEVGSGGSSVNLRLKRKADSRRESSAALDANGGTSSQDEVAMDMKQRYVGHCNTGTDIKQASFLGERGEYVASGSDDGRWFIWQKKTGRVLKVLHGDENVVNCVQCHPYDCTVATSGIDNTIKLWEPSVFSNEGKCAIPEAARIMADNQEALKRHRESGFPIEFLQRIRGVEGAPFECTQS